jgi:hypothetical protein
VRRINDETSMTNKENINHKRTMDSSYFRMRIDKKMLEFGVSELGIPSSFGFRYSDFSTERW